MLQSMGRDELGTTERLNSSYLHRDVFTCFPIWGLEISLPREKLLVKR